MSLAEIKEKVRELTADERRAFQAHREMLQDFEDPDFRKRLDEALDDIEKGVNVVSKDEMLNQLRTQGRAV